MANLSHSTLSFAVALPSLQNLALKAISFRGDLLQIALLQQPALVERLRSLRVDQRLQLWKKLKSNGQLTASLLCTFPIQGFSELDFADYVAGERELADFAKSLARRGISIDVLKTIDFNNNKMLTDRALQELVSQLQKAAQPPITLSDVIQATPRTPPNAEALRFIRVSGATKLSDLGLIPLVKISPNLQHLFAAQCPHITDKTLVALGQHCTALKTLSLTREEQPPVLLKINLKKGPKFTKNWGSRLRPRSEKTITDAGLVQLAAGCHHLKYLGLGWCFGLTDSGISALARSNPLLAYIDIVGLDLLTDAALEAIADNCPHLVALSLPWCVGVRGPGLAAVAAKCPNLRRLETAWCRSLSRSALAAVARHSTKLSYLRWTGCKAANDDVLIDLATHSERLLVHLDLWMTPHVSDVGVRAVTERLTALEELRIGSPRVTDYAIGAIATRLTNLRTLDLGGCPKISAAAVEALMAGLSTRGALTAVDLSFCPQFSQNQLAAWRERFRALSIEGGQDDMLENDALAAKGDNRVRAGTF